MSSSFCTVSQLSETFHGVSFTFLKHFMLFCSLFRNISCCFLHFFGNISCCFLHFFGNILCFSWLIDLSKDVLNNLVSLSIVVMSRDREIDRRDFESLSINMHCSMSWYNNYWQSLDGLAIWIWENEMKIRFAK